MDGERTSPYQFYQFWINADDRDVALYTRTFSLRDRAGLAELLSLVDENPRAAKNALAEELTARVHGDEALENAAAVSEMLFNRKASNEQLRGLKTEALAMIAEEIPSVVVPAGVLKGEGIALANLLDKHSSVKSISEAKRAIKGNAVSVNKEKITDQNTMVTSTDLLKDRYVMLENGKKNKLMVIAMPDAELAGLTSI